MKAGIAVLRTRAHRALLLTVGGTLALLCSARAEAALVLSFESPVSANANSTKNGLDVLLTNTSAGAVSIGAFAFEISTPSSDIALTDATTATVAAPYVFDGFSLFGPDILFSSTGQDLTASDAYGIGGSGAALAAGATVALGHILFDVLGVPPPQTIALSFTTFPATSLADEQGNDLAIDSLTTGFVVVGPAAVLPEPSTLPLVFLAALPLAWGRCRRRPAQS